MVMQPKPLKDSFYENYKRTSNNKVLEESVKRKSTEWLNQRKMNTQRRAAARRNIADKFQTVGTGFPTFGEMYFYAYDAMTKDSLPYWDFYPLVLPFSISKNNTFYGINLHYLPPAFRVLVLDILAETKRGKLKINIGQFNRLVQSNEFKPAIHQYRFDHIKSTVAKIPYEEWENVINLPLADWRSVTGGKPHTNKVYSDNIRKRRR